MRRRRTPDDRVVAATWQCASLLLDYPGAVDLDPVARTVPELPATFAEPLGAVLEHLRSGDPTELQASYVDTFDTRRRHNLFLTYFQHGDTRKRGMALLRFKQAYLAAGVQLGDEELPDHLCVVLEFGACVDLGVGRQLLLDHRAGLELLRMALVETESPWAGAVVAVTATLPALRGDEREAVRRLAEQGPPDEEVGLTPYGTPAFDARLAEARGPVDLPMPTLAAPGSGRVESPRRLR